MRIVGYLKDYVGPFFIKNANRYVYECQILVDESLIKAVIELKTLLCLRKVDITKCTWSGFIGSSGLRFIYVEFDDPNSVL